MLFTMCFLVFTISLYALRAFLGQSQVPVCFLFVMKAFSAIQRSSQRVSFMPEVTRGLHQVKLRHLCLECIEEGTDRDSLLLGVFLSAFRSCAIVDALNKNTATIQNVDGAFRNVRDN